MTSHGPKAGEEGGGTSLRKFASIQTLIHYFLGTISSNNNAKCTMPNALSEFVTHSQKKTWR